MSKTQRDIILAICIALAALSYIVGVSEEQPLLQVGGLVVFLGFGAFIWFGGRREEEKDDEEGQRGED